MTPFFIIVFGVRYHSHFRDDETKAPKGSVTQPRDGLVWGRELVDLKVLGGTCSFPSRPVSSAFVTLETFVLAPPWVIAVSSVCSSAVSLGTLEAGLFARTRSSISCLLQGPLRDGLLPGKISSDD